jgi:hypothetical protein
MGGIFLSAMIIHLSPREAEPGRRGRDGLCDELASQS